MGGRVRRARLASIQPALLAALLVLASCSKPPEVPFTPELHGWKEEGDLVVNGLAEVKALWKAGQREAARKLAEQVYTERWEPRLERAAQQMDPDASRQTEFAFGLLLVELETRGGRDHVDERIRTVDERVEAVTRAAQQAFPPPGAAGAPPTAEADAPTRPIVPPVAPAWEEAQ